MTEPSPLTAAQRARLEVFVKSGILPTVETWAKRMSAPIWWGDPDPKRERGVKGGTVCFVHTGQRLLGVTAEHVHQEAVSRSDRAWCQVGGHTFHPTDRLIDADQALDIATYDFTEIMTNAVGADTHHAAQWPPEAADGEPGLVCGWPWELASPRASAVTHRFLHFLCRLQRTSPWQLGAATFTSTSVSWEPSQLPTGTKLGGMSGGPVYVIRESPLTQLVLVGIVYEYQPSFELVLARPLGLVRADGTIVRV